MGERCVRNAEVMGSIPTRSTSRLCLLPMIGGRTAEIKIRHTLGRFGYHRSIPADGRAAEIGGNPGFGVFYPTMGKTCMAHMGDRSIAEIRMVYAIFPWRQEARLNTCISWRL